MDTPGTPPDPAARPFAVDRAFVDAHAPWMLALARRVLGDAQLAEDAVQDALLAVHGAGAGFEGRARLRTWLYRVTLNAALAIQRKRDPGPCAIDALQPDFDADACRIEEPWARLRTVEELMEQTELRAFVQRSIDRLPEDYRTCLQLRDIEDLPVREVAEILEITPANVKVRTHRARSALKRMLEPLLRGRPVDDITAGELPRELRPSFARIAKGLLMATMPMMITCAQFEDFVSAYLDGELSAFDRRRFELHVRSCRECREYLAAYERTREVARERGRLITTLEDVPEDLLRAVLRVADP